MLRELRTFIAVCRVGTFTAAAVRQGMTQSAVSDHIARLESFVGGVLFQRTGRSATLNQAGTRLLPLAEEAVLLMERMRSEAQPGLLRGRLRVGTVASLHNTLVARAMIAFNHAHREVSVRLIRHEGTMLQQVEREELDLAVVVYADEPIPPTLSQQPLMRLPFVMIVPAALPVASWREALQMLPLLRYDESSSTGQEVDAFLRRHGIAITDSLWINYLDTIVSLVGQGLGVAFVPRISLGAQRRIVRVLALGPATFHRRIGILRRKNMLQAAALSDAFGAALFAEAQREPYAEAPIPAALTAD